MPPVTDKNRPAKLPPEDTAAGAATAGAGAPTLEVADLTAGSAALEPDAPALTPPAEAVAAEADAAIGAWHNSVKITALWCNASARNAWAAVEGLGWHRIAPVNDSSFVTLTAMLGHARQMNAPCNVRIESDNQIHEAYVW